MRGTTRRPWGIGLCVAAVVPLLAGALWVDEEVSINQVPEAVRQTILRIVGHGMIDEIEMETEDGVTIYEADLVVDGKDIEIRVAVDGTLLGRHRARHHGDADRFTVDQLPEAARATLRRLARGAKLIKAEREREDGVIVYEAEWQVGGVKHEASVMTDGTLIETEQLVSADSAPASVRAAIATHFGLGAKVVIEKKMVVVYEVKGKIDGRMREMLVFPTGRVQAGDDDDDDEDDDDDDDHDEHDDDDHDDDHDHDDDDDD